MMMIFYQNDIKDYDGKFFGICSRAIDKCLGFCYYKQANRKKIDELLNLFGNERCHSCVSTFY